MTEIFLVRPDKGPRYARECYVLAFSTLEKARAYTESWDREVYTDVLAKAKERGLSFGPNEGANFFLKRAGVFDKREEGDPDNVWICGDGWYITREQVNPEFQEIE